MTSTNICYVSLLAVTLLVSIATCLNPSPNKLRGDHLKLQSLFPVKVRPYMTLTPYYRGFHPLKRSMETVDALLNIPLKVLCQAGKRSGQVRSTVCPMVKRSGLSSLSSQRGRINRSSPWSHSSQQRQAFVQ